MVKKILNIVVLVLVIPLVLVLLIVLLPFILVGVFIREKKIKARLKRFRTKEAGKFYLICSRRAGWYEFIQNNVIPILPPTVKITWYRRDREQIEDDIHLLLSRSSEAYGVPKPFLVAIWVDNVKVESLHEALIELKEHRHKDETTRERTRDIVQSKLRNF